MLLEWELWLDNHLSPIIAKWITEELSISAKSSYVLRLQQLEDIDLFNKARVRGKVILLTKDGDFEQLVRKFGAPPKIINITIGNTDNKILWAWLRPRLPKAIDLLLNFDFDFIQID